ncbi:MULTISPECIES: cytochrome c biogenesis protein ResB [unclassified Lentimonas]|uniref:cytochrome c biogenesis protein ResB n=1 Tax=unclassified Lentimonas TaxID=2630993 RepID=UPI0013286F40|nr:MULTISPECIES: cytochrome c biogenesis protein ResB [unclassified Lentimonas]CAA6679453.1 Putative cytochrome C-type biogenesis protein [Lentimonas sp. CC4]CAA6687124.1 Putative cytochrome C-type biogenesis protein [Lentimonas sp. CC6]CAA6691511.1 Putative cytochrome C-type biogenesis protein [Lentimonas sp. CC10]CAA6696174.1 Putative cytochrome C-type biogenesis protein [Lentimonas sp. CC19]CAA7070908.1 Putative cytochrome C-type biogenesis protein [Lentimonas sp. CC11]
MKALFKFFASLRLTVVLLAFSMVLIFFGTLAQVETGIWKTQKDYFESFIAIWSYPGSWVAQDALHWLRIPMPGGYLLGGMLLINLVAAHITRFKFTAKKSGIFLIHLGLILLLVSELLTDLVSKESQMPVDEGGRSNYSQEYRDNELVLIDRSNPDFDTIHSIPVSLLKPGKTIAVPDSPLSIRTVSYYPNAKIGRATEGAAPVSSPANQGIAVKMNVVVTPAAVTYAENQINTATAYVEVLSPEGSLGTWLVSNVIDDRFPAQIVRLGEQSWEMVLRLTRHYYPFEVELINFSHDKYPGTEIPFNFSSEVMVHHEDSTKNQKALIYMNHPLRYEGLTFYQASFANDNRTSIFQVVRNPGWALPYISVLLMGVGMLVQFGMHFFKFLKKRTSV